MSDDPTSGTAFGDLDARARRRLLIHTLLRISASVILLFVLYAIIPDAHRSGTTAVIELILGLLVLIGLLTWQIRRILTAPYPGLRALETLALALTLLVVVFAYTYLSLSESNTTYFSQPLDHIGAIYFTVTVLSTVGFGDIVARTDATRLIVTVQIVLDLVLVAGIARTIVFAAKLGARRRETERQEGQRGGGPGPSDNILD